MVEKKIEITYSNFKCLFWFISNHNFLFIKKWILSLILKNSKSNYKIKFVQLKI